MNQPQERPAADSRRGGFGLMAWVLALVLMAYPLSTGPFVKLVEHNVIAPTAVETVYAPLEWLCRNCKPADEFFRWYIGKVWGYKG